jgi:perosamine synthetase
MSQLYKPLKNKFVDIDRTDESAVLAALRRKQLSGTADIVAEFEQAVASYFYSPYAVASCNGTAAIHLALLALDITAGDEVIVPPTAPVMTVLPILLANAVPVFADVISDQNFGFDLSNVQQKITPKTKAIITVPMWGYPMEMSRLVVLCQKKNIALIEDCSQAHGTKMDGKYLGTFGDIGLWSAHDRKLVACGEGAFMVTESKDLSEKLQEGRAFGRVIRQTRKLKKYPGQFGVQFGLNYKIHALGAALGISQLKKLDKKIKIRTKNARAICAGITDLPWLKEIEVTPGGVSNYYALVLYVDPEFASGEEISRKLLAQNIVSDTLEYTYCPLYEMPLFKKFAAKCPNAKRLTQRIITIPTHEGITAEDIQHIIAALKGMS